MEKDRPRELPDSTFPVGVKNPNPDNRPVDAKFGISPKPLMVKAPANVSSRHF